MNSASKDISRRNALLATLNTAAFACINGPVVAAAMPEVAAQAPAEFVPENDYPFFGGELPEQYRLST